MTTDIREQKYAKRARSQKFHRPEAGSNAKFWQARAVAQPTEKPT